MKKVVITGGHLTPALALIEEIKNDSEKWQIYFLGRKYSIEGLKETSFEFETISKFKKIKFIPLATGRIQRKFTRKTIPGFLKIPSGFFQAFITLAKIKPDLIISFGGYLSTPVILSGWLLNVPSINHSQASALGLADKINLLFVKKFAFSFPHLKEKLPLKKSVLTGNPVRKEIFQKKPLEKSSLYLKIKTREKPLLYIVGGKTGSKIINQVIAQIVDQLTEKFFVLHQVGLDKGGDLGSRKNYLATKFVDTVDIGWVLNQTELAVSRAGANYVLEFALLKKKAVLIPIPESAGNEQEKNAQFLEKIGLAIILPQKDLNPKNLLRAIDEISLRKTKPKYPSWFQKNQPQKAAQKLWQLAKTVLKS